MVNESIASLVAQLNMGKLSRREFTVRAGAAGLSAALIGQAIRVADARAQDATPEAEGASSTSIGNPEIAHVADTSKGTIKLYSSWPLTASMQKIGEDAVTAAQMCLEDFGNAAGGFEIVYEALDDGVAANEGKWEPGKETENATKAINDADCMVYLGTYNSGAAKISIPLLNVVPMAMLSFANTYQGLTKNIEGAVEEGEPDIYYPSGSRNYMRVCPADDIQGGAGARFAIAEGKKKAYVLHDNSLYGKGVAKVFEMEFVAQGGESLGFEGWDAAAGDYQALATSVADKGPDVVYLGATVDNNAGKVMQDIRSVVPADQAIAIGSDGLTNDSFIEASAGTAEGCYLTFAGYTPDKLVEQGGAGADYVNRISEKLDGNMPDSYAVYSYEAMVVVIQALDKVGEKDRAKILEAMITTSGFNSLLGGTWSFTETGDTDSSIIGLAQVVDGKIAFQKAIS